MFSSNNGDRPEARNIAVIITDGASNDKVGSGYASDYEVGGM